MNRRNTTSDRPWNVNIHYDALLARLVPPGARGALDVGCGDGFLAARLCEQVDAVVAVDADAAVLDRARARFAGRPVSWRRDDVLDLTTRDGRYDAVLSNATLHHLPDASQALAHLAELVEPGGVLAIVTFARTDLVDLPWQGIAWVARAVANTARGKWEHSAPICWPPRDSRRDLRAAAAAALPQARVSRLWFGRVLISWTKPIAR